MENKRTIILKALDCKILGTKTWECLECGMSIIGLEESLDHIYDDHCIQEIYIDLEDCTVKY